MSGPVLFSNFTFSITSLIRTSIMWSLHLVRMELNKFVSFFRSTVSKVFGMSSSSRKMSQFLKVMAFSARVLMAKTCSVVDLPLWYALCDKGMCFIHSGQHLRIIDMVSIFLNGDSRMIGLGFTFSFFFSGFARGLSVSRWMSSEYSPVLLVLFWISHKFTNSWFDPYFTYCAWTPSDPVTLLFLNFFDAF